MICKCFIGQFGSQIFTQLGRFFIVLYSLCKQCMIMHVHDLDLSWKIEDCERPLAQSFGHNLFMVQEREVQVGWFGQGPEGSAGRLLQARSNAMTSGLKSLQFNAYNPSETNILVYYTQDGGCYDLFVGLTTSAVTPAFSQTRQCTGRVLHSAQSICSAAAGWLHWDLQLTERVVQEVWSARFGGLHLPRTGRPEKPWLNSMVNDVRSNG